MSYIGKLLETLARIRIFREGLFRSGRFPDSAGGHLERSAFRHSVVRPPVAEVFEAAFPATAALMSLDQTPDRPQMFGYKISWFAVKAADPVAVVAALELGEAVPANWASGLALQEVSRRGDRWLFVSPSISGWVLVVSSWQPYPAAADAEYGREIGRKFDRVFSRLMKRFDDVQFFGSLRTCDFVAWARALNGKPIRMFAYADGAV